jgi:hypothetical protein
MGIDRRHQTPESHDPNSGNGTTKWILSTLSLLCIYSCAARAFRRHRPSVIQINRLQTAPEPHDARFSGPVRGHENRDANVKWIFGLVVFLFVSGLCLHGIMAGYLTSLQHTPMPTDQWEPIANARQPSANAPPGPQLQISPPADLKAFRAREEAELHSYGWLDQTAGVVRIPIERAMELVLKEGLPARPTTNEIRLGPSSYDLILQRTQHSAHEIKGGS